MRGARKGVTTPLPHVPRLASTTRHTITAKLRHLSLLQHGSNATSTFSMHDLRRALLTTNPMLLESNLLPPTCGPVLRDNSTWVGTGGGEGGPLGEPGNTTAYNNGNPFGPLRAQEVDLISITQTCPPRWTSTRTTTCLCSTPRARHCHRACLIRLPATTLPTAMASTEGPVLHRRSSTSSTT